MLPSNPIDSNLPRFFQSVLALLPLYTVALSCVYLAAYWTSFDVSFVEYVDLADIPKLALYAFVPTAMGFLGGPLLEALRAPLRTQNVEYQFKISLKSIGGIGFGFIFLAYIDPYSWPLVAALAFGSLLFPKFAIFLRQKWVSHVWIAYAVAMLLLLIPFMAIGYGFSKAQRMKHGTASEIVVLSLANYDSKLIKSDIRMHHIGHLRNFDFFYIPSMSRTIRVPTERISEMQLFSETIRCRCYVDASGQQHPLPQPWSIYSILESLRR